MPFLKIIAFSQLVVVAARMFSSLTTSQDFSAFFLLCLTTLFCTGCALIALWALVCRPAERRLAALVLATPIAGTVLVSGANFLLGVPALRAKEILIAAMVVIVVAALFLPRRIARAIPSGVTRSLPFNVLILAVLLAAIAGWILPFLALFGLPQASGPHSPESNHWIFVTWGRNWFVSLTGALPALFYGYVNLFRTRDRQLRRIHTGQMAASTVLLCMLVPMAWIKYEILDRLV